MFQSVTFKSSLTAAQSECLVLPYFGEKGKGQPLDARTKALAAGMGILDSVNAALARPEATGDANTLVEAFAPVKAKRGAAEKAALRILLLGLGSKEKCEAGGMRNAAAAVGRRLASVKGLSLIHI